MSGCRIVVDEDEPETDVVFPTVDAESVEVVCDRWVSDDFEIRGFLGRGKFGEVVRCSSRATGVEYAAKFIRTPRDQDKRDVEHEVKMMRRLSHRRIAHLHQAFEAPTEMCIVLELMEGGELFDRVSSDEFQLTERACVCIVRQICEGVEYMHSRNMVHLDLKPENVMCLSREGNRVKIIDFGLTRVFDPSKDTRVLLGTPEFMAPEVVLFDPIHFVTDIWSVGVICYVLLSGLSPFMGNNDATTLSNVTTGKFDFNYPEFQDVSEEAKDFIRSALIIDKRKRSTASECLQHRWLQKPDRSNSVRLNLSKEQMKSFLHNRKWKKAFNVIVALKRMKPKTSTVQSSSFSESDSINLDCNFQPLQPLLRAIDSIAQSTQPPTELTNSQDSHNSNNISIAQKSVTIATSKEHELRKSDFQMQTSKAAKAKDSKAKDNSNANRGHLALKQPNKNGLSNFQRLRSIFANK